LPHVIKACDDCRQSYICFIVKKPIWTSLFERYDQARVCMPCFEKRLGRRLTHRDLASEMEIFEMAVRCNDFYRAALTPL